MESGEGRGERGDLKAVQFVVHHYGVRIILAQERSTYFQRLLQGSGVRGGVKRKILR
jgi:hypothetical protein